MDQVNIYMVIHRLISADDMTEIINKLQENHDIDINYRFGLHNFNFLERAIDFYRHDTHRNTDIIKLFLDHGADQFLDKHTIDYITNILDYLKKREYFKDRYDALQNLLDSYAVGTKEPGYE